MRWYLFLFILLFFIPFAHAETIIYDNLSSSNYKVLIINDDLQNALINDYSYDVYVNDKFLGSYKKDEKIFVPDNSNISIYVPQGNIQTDLTQAYDVQKTQIYIALMYIVSGFTVIFLIVYFIKKIWRK